MKIQTQTKLLIFSIVAAPLFIMLTQIVYRLFLSDDAVTGLPSYNAASSMMEDRINRKDWDPISRDLVRFRQLGDVAVFRNDFLVLYSEISDFKSDTFESMESILPLLENKRFIFNSIGLEGNQGYILVNLKHQSFKENFAHFFIPALICVIFICLLTIFSICMSIIIARTITNSVKVLEDATRRIAEGELDLKVEAKGSNEIISLTKSLNKMRDALKEDELRRSRFIMGITHDLKTPLALIKGYAEAIEDGVTGDAVSRSGATEIIIEKADQLEDMINDLIGYVHMETGEWRTQLKHTILLPFINELAGTMKNDAELLQHTLEYEINLQGDISIPLDEKLVIRAFENIIHNAVRYTPKESIINLAAICHGNTVVITISDNGPGLDKEELPHIFEMFYRGSSSRREQGMGLGLAVVKWVVDYHGWDITVSSEKGKGTCFSITIPLC